MSEIQNNCATLRLCDCATVRLCDGELPSVEPSQLMNRVSAIAHCEQIGIATACNQVIGIGAFRREAL